MHEFRNRLRAEAAAMQQTVGAGRWAVVTSSRSTDTGYSVKVRIQPENVQTTWLPVLSPMVGNGWGIVCPPNQGQQVFIEPVSGSGDSYVVTGMAYSLKTLPPQPGGNPVSPGEVALVHQTGSFLWLHNDGSIDVTSNQDGCVTVGRNLMVTVTGNATVNVTGNATMTVTGTASIFAAAVQLGKQAADTLHGLCTSIFKTWADTHVHSVGGPPPTTTAGDGALTSIVTAE